MGTEKKRLLTRRNCFLLPFLAVLAEGGPRAADEPASLEDTGAQIRDYIHARFRLGVSPLAGSNSEMLRKLRRHTENRIIETLNL